MTTVVRSTLLGLLGLLIVAPAAGADPPGPTDYASEITSVVPPSAELSIEILGGDSFVLLTQLGGEEIVVIGYGGEQYLRFLADGTVQRNRRSPATYFNEDRYGADADELPEIADASAEPEWVTVDDDGTYAWHDHRAHWMADQRPLGAAAGDQILEGVIPLIVGGDEVDVTVASFWMPAPSPLPPLLGALAGALFGLLAWRKRRLLPAILGLAGVVSAGLGLVQAWSMPSETGPSMLLWLLPTVAVVGAVGGWWSRRRPASALPLLLASAVAVLAFAGGRVSGLGRAILPTDVPFWLDRAATAGLALTGAAGVLLAGVELSRLLGREPIEPLPTTSV